MDGHRKEYIVQNKADKHDDPIGSNAFDLIIQKAEEDHTIKFESDKNAFSRVQHCKEKVREYIATHQLTPDQKVVVLSHYYILKLWTGDIDHDVVLENDGLHVSEFVEFQNCDVHFDSDFEILEKIQSYE